MNWGVIFDWDGVVVDSSKAHCLSWEQLAAEEAQLLPPDHMARGFGKKNTTIIPDILGWTLDPLEIERLSERKEAIYRDLLATGKGNTLPGVEQLLPALAAEGVPMAVGSSTARANIEQAIAQFSLKGYFQAIAAAEDCRAGKPDPGVFLAAAAKLGLHAKHCVVIEDAPYGIEAAHRAEMKAVALLTSHKKSTMADADLIVGDLSELDVHRLHSLIT